MYFYKWWFQLLHIELYRISHFQPLGVLWNEKKKLLIFELQQFWSWIIINRDFGTNKLYA